MLLRSVVGLVLLCALALPAQAQEKKPDSGFTFHGFAIGTVDSGTSRIDPHVRLILQQALRENLDAKLAITHVGGRTFASFYELIWRPNVKGVDQVSIGRSFPVFGEEWWEYRVDELPWALFSETNNPLSVSDLGVRISGHTGRLIWYVSGYLGEPEFGNYTSPSLYARMKYRLSPTLSVGGSYRLSDPSAHGLDLVFDNKKIKIIAELVSSDGISQYAILGQYRVTKRLSALARYEWLEVAPDRWSLGAEYKFGEHADLRVLRMNGGSSPEGRWIVQLATRW